MNAFKKSWFSMSVAVLAIGAMAVPAIAHHSFAAYNMSKKVTTEGTIKEFRWGAPHSSMVLNYVEKGKPKAMSIISGSPLSFSKQGFKPRDFKRGDKVKVTYHPNTSGLPGGAMASMKMANGKTYSDTEAAQAGGN
jgi:Family of unknown function (DUF6152)